MHKKIMVQGTGSSVGKSIITIGLCRIFAEEGYTVAPFKSQNIGLNSYVDDEGKELSKAQSIQAEAAKTSPKSFMNPILLKPNGNNINSQVVLEGIPYRNMDIKEYYEEYDFFKKIIEKNYKELSEKFQIGVLEGSGSLAEINLREKDLVNMEMAAIADSNVILVTDMKNGGVFASIYGSVKLLESKDRKRLKGYIVNKFEGDISLFEEGIKLLDEKFKKEGIEFPCLGVIPYIDLKIENEDSYNFASKDIKLKKDINIGVINFEKLSNSTDFTALLLYEDVSLTYINEKEDLDEDFDMIILPGSKNALYDYSLMEARKITEGIKYHAEKGTVILGIHSGFQMLGKSIKDLKQVESMFLKAETLNLFDMSTRMDKKKYTKQVSVDLKNCTGFLEGFDGINVYGCEIHQGVTTGEAGKYSITEEEPFTLICKENIIGTYIHGLFDSPKFARKFLNKLREKKGLTPLLDYISVESYQETEFKKLAKVMRENLDIDKILTLLK